MENSKIKVVIIEDVQPTLNHLKLLIHKSFRSELEILGTAESVDEGVRLIRETEPEIVLLDIELKDQTAFDLLNHFSELFFWVIFTTAHSEYALKAINTLGHIGFGYLIKPIKEENLGIEIKKYVSSQKHSKENNEDKNILKFIEEQFFRKEKTEIIFEREKKFYRIPFKNIIKIESEKGIPIIHYIEGDIDTYNSSKILDQALFKQASVSQIKSSDLTSELNSDTFLEISRGIWVNKAFILVEKIKLITKGNRTQYQLVLADGGEVNVSHRRTKNFKRFMGIL